MNTHKAYLPEKHAVAMFEQKATAKFWDEHWQRQEIRNSVVGFQDDRLFIPLVRKYLPKGSLILEGGCGMGQLVNALSYQGYKALGLDYAEQTLSMVKTYVPEMRLIKGDLRHLPFKDRSLDGYISAGVIEHFWDGYQLIIAEASRTLNQGGYMFLSFPYLSPLRKLKLFLNRYATTYTKADVKDFYQFIFDMDKVVTQLGHDGFTLVEKTSYDGIKGCKDEVKLLKPLLQQVYDGKLWQRHKLLIDTLLKPYSSHMALLVFKKIN